MTVKRHSKDEAQAIMDRLQKLSCDDLHELFKQGRVPEFEEIAGKNPGIELKWHPRNPLINKLGWRFYGNNPLARWAGMEFIKPFTNDKKGDGYNLYHNRIWKRRYKYETYIDKAVSDNDPCLRINYSFPSPMFMGFDDTRMVEDGVLLALAYAKRERILKSIPGFYWVSITVEQ